jgi:hypothetical protein
MHFRVWTEQGALHVARGFHDPPPVPQTLAAALRAAGYHRPDPGPGRNRRSTDMPWNKEIRAACTRVRTWGTGELIHVANPDAQPRRPYPQGRHIRRRRHAVGAPLGGRFIWPLLDARPAFDARLADLTPLGNA